MNPICQRDIRSEACFRWMCAVSDICKQLLADEQPDYWEAWWHDTTPPVYKPDFEQMTSYDCRKLKRDLKRTLNKVRGVLKTAPTRRKQGIHHNKVTAEKPIHKAITNSGMDDNLWWMCPSVQVVITAVVMLVYILWPKVKSVNLSNPVILFVEPRGEEGITNRRRLRFPLKWKKKIRLVFLHSNKHLKERAQRRRDIEYRRELKIEEEKIRLWTPKELRKDTHPHYHHKKKNRPDIMTQM